MTRSYWTKPIRTSRDGDYGHTRLTDPRPTRAQIYAEFRRAGPLLLACVVLAGAVTFLFVAMGW